LKTFSLQSGSNGNSFYVELDGVCLLFDAGLTGAAAERRMSAHGRDIRDVDALFISHEHPDHIRGAGVYQRKFGLPIYMTERTQDATRCKLGQPIDITYFKSGDTVPINGVRIHTYPTAHDAVDGVCFVVEGGRRRLGIFSDLGHAFPELLPLVESVDAAYIECNYDSGLLASGSYPEELKARIQGPHGHLSNDDTAALLAACRRSRPKWVAVAHLSEQNNTPELAIGALHEALGDSYPVHHASRYDCSNMFVV